VLNTDATHTHAQDRPSGGPLVVDAHLDVAWNAIHYSRELSLTVDEIRASEPVQPAVAMTSLHAFSQASIAVVFATLFAYPAEAGDPGIDLHLARAIKGYRTAAEAEQQALEMLSIYNRWEDQGRIRIIRSRDSLEAHLLLHQQDRVPGFLILMEGAEPIRAPELLPEWFERGVRMIGLAWQSTSYAGGTGSTDGLTDRGRELLRAMADLKIIHDASHLSEEAFWESAGLPHRGLCVTHANVRKLMLPRPGGRVTAPLNRHLSDEQIAEVARGHGAATRGVIGLVLLNESLDPR
jgi:membrane dipeptidase